MHQDSADGPDLPPTRAIFSVLIGFLTGAGAISDTPGADAQPEPIAPKPPPSGPRPWRLSRVYIALVIAIVLVVVVAAYFETDGFHQSGGSSGSTGTVLIPYGTGYSYVIGQFNGITFTASSPSTIAGSLDSSEGIQIYILTTAEFEFLAKNLSVGQYVWTSGKVADDVVYNLSVTVSPGQWVLSFVNPNPNLPTGVGFYSNVVLEST